MNSNHLTRNLIITAVGAFALWIMYLVIAFRDCGNTSGNMEIWPVMRTRSLANWQGYISLEGGGFKAFSRRPD